MRMGYTKGKSDIAGIVVSVAMFGSLYEIPDKDMEDEKKPKRV